MANFVPLRIAFMGTPDFAVVALQALHAAGHNIAAVYCQPPKPAGRGQQMQVSAVQRAAEKLGLEIRTPKTLRDPAEQEKFDALGLDVAVVAAYGLILPQRILQMPKYGCLNIHASLLPRWRGAAPIQRAILAGDAESGITIMQMDAGLDTGAILLQEHVRLMPFTTSQNLHDDLAKIGGRLIVDALAKLPGHEMTPQPQAEAGAIYADKLSRLDGQIDWSKPADYIERQIRALTPWPGCFFALNGETVKLLSAAIVPQSDYHPPSILLDDQFTVSCGKDALRLTSLQRPGKTPTEGAALLRGLRLAIGAPL